MTLQELESELKVKWDELVAHIHALFNKSSVTPVSPASAQDIAPQSAPVETPPAPATPTTGTSNWLTGDIASQANPVAQPTVVSGPEEDDTQRPDVLDKDTYQGKGTTFVGTKTITGTGKVNIRTDSTLKLGATQASPESPMVVTVNGVSQSSVIAQNPFTFTGVDLPATVTTNTPIVMAFNG